MTNRPCPALAWRVAPHDTRESAPAEWVSATVPGAVQLDWARAKHWPAYWQGENFRAYDGLEDRFWTYETRLEFPALAARQLGWKDVPLLCSYEVDVPGSLRRCVRIMVMWNTDKPQSEIRHVYIKEAQRLRPDICKLPPVDFAELEAWIAEHIHKGSA